jgi:hypothetical protein
MHGRGVYRVLVGRPNGKRPLGRPTHRWEDNIMMDLREKICDSLVGIVLGYVLNDWGSRVRFLVEAGNFSPHHRIHNGSGAHPASSPMGIRGSFPGGKLARA